MRRILLLGSNGQVGYELTRSLGPLAEIIMPARNDIDLSSNKQLIADKIQQLEPDLVINAAAYTAVDKAEEEIELAWQINATAPAVLAASCESMHIPLIHFSTDYVFDGHSQRPWKESDQTAPLNVYGQSKLAGEQAIRDSQVKHAIFRTSWVYGVRGHNFLNTMRRVARDKASLNIVSDQIGAPTWSRHIAEAVTAIVAMAKHKGIPFWDDYSGTYHLTNAGTTSWFGFAEAIFEEMHALGQRVPIVNPINTDAYPTPAKRPLFSELDNTLLESRLGIKLPDWRQALRQVMQDFQI